MGWLFHVNFISHIFMAGFHFPGFFFGFPSCLKMWKHTEKVLGKFFLVLFPISSLLVSHFLTVLLLSFLLVIIFPLQYYQLTDDRQLYKDGMYVFFWLILTWGHRWLVSFSDLIDCTKARISIDRRSDMHLGQKEKLERRKIKI